MAALGGSGFAGSGTPKQRKRAPSDVSDTKRELSALSGWTTEDETPTRNNSVTSGISDLAPLREPMSPASAGKTGPSHERRLSLGSSQALREALQDQKQQDQAAAQARRAAEREASCWSRFLARCPTSFSIKASMELRDLNFTDLTRQKFGDSARWADLPVNVQVEIISDALRAKFFLIDPSSDYMKVWDITVVLCLIFTAIVTPYEIAYLTPKRDFLYGLNRVVDAIFVKDMFMQFFLKVKRQTRQGTIWIRNRRQIAKLYMKSWFFIDVLAIVPYDEFATIDTGGGEESSAALGKLKLMRLLRALRLFKLVRIVKASRLFKRWENRIGMQHSKRYLIKFTILIVLACHWMACMWGFFGILEGTNLMCKFADMNPIDPSDPLLEEYPERTYFFKDNGDTNPYIPDLWVGQSWVVSWADGRAGSTPVNPCDHLMIYLAALYWAVMTITSIGYGDILPVTSTEYIVCCTCMMASSILWAYIIGAACAVMSNMDPENAHFERRMDNFNAMAHDQDLQQKIRYRGREYLREERFHEHYLRNRAAVALLSADLRNNISRQMASHYLDNIWFFRRSTESVREDVANKFMPHFYEIREVVLQVGQLCVVERGSVGRGGRILVPWSYWGDDMLLRDKALQVQASCFTLTYTEILTLSRSDLSSVLMDYPEEIQWFRRAAAVVALSRAANIYRAEMKPGAVRQKEHKWIRKLFDNVDKVENRQSPLRIHKKQSAIEEQVIGDVIPTVDERLQKALAILDRTERGGQPAEKIEQKLKSIQEVFNELEAAPSPNGKMPAVVVPLGMQERAQCIQAQLELVEQGFRELAARGLTSNRSPAAQADASATLKVHGGGVPGWAEPRSSLPAHAFLEASAKHDPQLLAVPC